MSGRWVDSISRDDLMWLAGWMEGEGSFMKPANHANNAAPRIAGISTDLDVITRVAGLIGCAVHEKKGKSLGLGSKTQYVFKRVSSVCAEIMTEIRPYMGERRQSQIDAALAAVPKKWTHPCQFCGGDIKRDPAARGRSPKYCSASCARDKRNYLQRERRSENRDAVLEYKREWRRKRKEAGLPVH